MTTLTKTRSVIQIDGDPSEVFGVQFAGSDPDNLEYWRFLGIDYGVWVELGSPTKVTITIEPGDLLNVD